ncbi:hypothetical protein BDQ12DRAFT_725782 [Crucibulum laeve]|uniref:BTB domain-containing protein n=1 Tax=Crucibulum laeve TaxID=68775 RepID=A0A5C3LRM5_9AGAR|nr:hypothetical protein BDQ12DRAFT_725782 [Crucibulum laeve]
MFKVNMPYVICTKVSDQFRATVDTDVTFQSSDGVLFHIQRKHVEATTGGFPPSTIPTFGQIVPLTEDAVALELLFQFVIPRRHPSLNDIDFQLLLKLAESAEKYEVYAAMNACNLRMSQMIHVHPVEILNHAIKHDYPYIIVKTTPFTLDLELQDVIARLPAHLLVPWVREKSYEWNAQVVHVLIVLCVGNIPATMDKRNEIDAAL